ncbi:CAP domain-containing protein [Streptomyces sp. MUM 2J]|uniref:CAP domain-containing protein n=1 Tax=Streptomyces sp. MUM 2J TaxID=2791987 RepID=UPI001F038DA5|nr:CAP domain-containing protein [Streptomyces sp. MUM 2J]MCH0566591.1 TerD family protein [Streptomyces sp. MUM 2J]
MSELVPGAHMPLPDGVLALRVPGRFDLCALVTGGGGKVTGDRDFVFYNQPSAPGVQLTGETLRIEPARLRAGASRATVAISAADPGTPLGRLPVPVLGIADARGRVLARFTPSPPGPETVLLLAEIYRRGPAWRLRALGQGYADGLAGLARDFGVDVVEDTAVPPAAGPVPPPAPERVTAPGGPSARDGFLVPVNAARAAAGSRPVLTDARLTGAAQAHARAMAAAGRPCAEGADGVSVHQRVTSAGYAYLAVGEHLVSGPLTAQEFVAYCLRGERTRRTLHDPAFGHVGLGHCAAGGDIYWTAVWAAPLTRDGLARTEAEVAELTNRERARAGLPPLGADVRLAAAARAHSEDMATRAYHAHTSPDGTQPWDRAAAAGSARRTIGENIACGQRSPAEVVAGWMDSPGHRANILAPAFTHIGVGFAGGGPSGTYWTQLFGA